MSLLTVFFPYQSHHVPTTRTTLQGAWQELDRWYNSVDIAALQYNPTKREKFPL
jgi:hypothetical protein